MKYPDHDTISAPLLEGPTAIRSDPVAGLRERATGHVYELASAKMRFSIGVGERCDIQLGDPYVSKRHCILERRGPARLVVRDANSKNGVAIDGLCIEVGDLRPGSRLRVGRTELVALSPRSMARATTASQLVGESRRFRHAVDLAVRAGASGCSVLILGETGTGKELFAQVVHESSARVDRQLVALNCGALSPGLLGSELFGHVRGAFTGAVADRAGVFAEANGGTLFLDEIGELPLAQQPHLLRVLETRRVRPVGSSHERSIDVQFVAATNRLDPVEAGVLRADLFHRIATVVIELPPLRERWGDIPLLVREFVRRATTEERPVAPEAMEALVCHHWPGNVRELRYAVERAVALCDDELTLDVLLPGASRASRATPAPKKRAVAREPEPMFAPESTFAQRERAMMLDAVAAHGSMRKAAEALKIPRSTFSDRLRRLQRKAG